MRDVLVLGVGMSSKATAEELCTLIDQALESIGADRRDVVRVATRERFADDSRITELLSVPMIAVTDADLIAGSGPVDRTVGIAASVARTAALSARRALAGDELDHHIIVELKSAHATVAIASIACATNPSNASNASSGSNGPASETLP